MNAKIQRNSTSALLSCFSIGMAALLASACASNSEIIVSKLDPRTSVTITYNHSPLVFSRTLDENVSRAEEHLYLGPVEVNRSGDYRYYLWAATWSTMDGSPDNPRPRRFETIEVLADGKPVTLKLTAGSLRSIGVSEPVYRKPVPWATEAYYGITLDQLRLMAEATELRAQYSSTRESYEPWDDQVSSKAGLDAFLAHSEY